MSSVVQNILDKTIGDGARSTKFNCFINFQNTGLFANESESNYLVKSSQFPGKTHEVIDFKFKGRNIPIKGQVKYDGTWTCTFYLTQDHEIKKAFEDWIESIDQVHNVKNVSSEVINAQQSNNAFTGSGYTTTMKLAQMDFEGRNNTMIYELYNVFPKSVSTVDVDYSSVGTILEFTVEFAYSYFDSYSTETNFVSLADKLQNAAGEFISSNIGALQGQISSAFSGLGKSSVSSIKNLTGVKAYVQSSDLPESMTSKIDW